MAGVDREVKVAADLSEVGERGLSAVAEAEGFAFVYFDGVEAFVQDSVGELCGAPEAKVVEWKDNGEVDAGFCEERELVRERRDEWEMLFGEEDVRRMRVEGGCDRACA